MLWLLVITILSTCLISGASADTKYVYNFQHAAVVSSQELHELIQSSSITVVYFFVEESQVIINFLEEYEISAKYLKVYNITLTVYNCSAEMADHPNCKREKKNDCVYIFQEGTELLTLYLASMFDMNSIMSNILQLALLQQVPIIQTPKELEILQKMSAGKQDILFAVTIPPGTQEHRMFLEVAYAFQDRFKFAITIDVKVVAGLNEKVNLPAHQEVFAMWTLFCGEPGAKEKMVADGVCQKVLYRGEVTFKAVAQYMIGLSEKTLYHTPADGLSEVFNMPDVLPIVFVYTNKDVQGQTTDMVEWMKVKLKAKAKVVVVDIGNEDCRSLAEQQGFSGNVPAIGVKKDGASVFMEEKQWALNNVQDFIASQVFHPNMATVKLSTDLSPPEDDYDIMFDEVLRQDDEIAAAVYKLSTKEMELDHVPALLKNTFYKVIASADLTMVLFYLPFDHLSMGVLREFGHAGKTLARNFSETNVLARVNCFDGTNLCAVENITTYPVLRIFRMGQNIGDYNGSLDSKSVIKAVKLLRLNSPVVLTSYKKVDKFIKGEHPHAFHNYSQSSVLLLTTKKDTDEEKLFINVAKTLSTITAFGVTYGELSSSVSEKYGVGVPSVLGFHRNDSNVPVRVLKEDLSEMSLTTFVKDSVIAAVPELTVMNLPTLFTKRQPFVILFLNLSDPVTMVAMETFTNIAMSGLFENVIFCWMNAQAKKIGQKILSEYSLTATLPAVTVVDHGKGELFNYQPENFELLGLSDWLTQVVMKKIGPSKILEYTEWLPPGPHYDFLAMMDKMEKQGPPRVEAFDEDQWYFEGSQSERFGEPERELTLQIDSEIREELLELRKSRIYQKNPERPDGNKKQQIAKQEATASHFHSHVEL